MDSPKSEALNAIRKLPETATLEDIMYELYVLGKIRSGREALAAGDIVTSGEFKKKIEAW